LWKSGASAPRKSTKIYRALAPEERNVLTITLNHFSAALVFALCASVVFGITHRETTRDMVRYGLYCFAMFLGGVFVAGWAMWLLRR
jgi:hypothetical protein